MVLDESEARKLVSAVDACLTELESLADETARNCASNAVQAVIDLYGAGLARILDVAPELGPRLVEDELVAHLLFLHDLHPVPIEDRVQAALESVRPYLATHGGNVELLAVRDGVAAVRLQGTCNGCPSSTETLKQAIEAAVFKAAPDLDRIDAQGVAAPNLISLESLVCPVPAPA